MDFLGFLILLGKLREVAPFSPKLLCVDVKTRSVRTKDD